MKKLFMSKYSRAGIDGLMDEYLGDIRLSKVLSHNLLATSYEINSHSAWNITKRGIVVIALDIRFIFNIEALMNVEKDFALADVAR